MFYWEKFINNEMNKEYFQNINQVLNDYDSYFPKSSDVFNAFKLTPYENIKVVLIGQDPYHNDNQAHGLAFSVLNQKAPKSLQNIFKELETDLNIKRTNTNLTDWANQGVFLINSTLTVKKHQPNSHKDIGWNIFTDNVIKEIEKNDNIIVYILLGTLAATMAHSGFTNIVSEKITKIISGKKYILLLILTLIAMASQNIVPIHIAFIPIIIPPLLSAMNALKIDRRAVASALAFGLKMPYITIPVGFGLIFQNLIADNMLTLSAGMVNLFEYDENMKYDETLMVQDIEKYGLYTYDDFKDYVSIEVFNAFPFKYYKVAIGKGLYTYEQVLGLIKLYNDLGSVK